MTNSTRLSARTWWAAVMAAGCVAVTVCGCRRAQANVEPQHRLLVWHAERYTPLARMIAHAARRLEKLNPGLQVQVAAMTPAAYAMKLRTGLCSNAMPDVFQTPSRAAPESYVRAGKLLDLTREMSRRGWRQRFRPASLGLCTVKTRRYAAPIAVDGLFLWCNKDRLAACGVEPPSTLSELDEACTRLRQAGVQPLALGNLDLDAGSEWAAYLALRIGGADAFDRAYRREPGGSFAHAAFVEAGRLLSLYAQRGWLGADYAHWTRKHAIDAFCSGRAALILEEATPMIQALAQRPGLAGHVVCLPFPVAAGGQRDPTTLVARVRVAFAVSKRAGEKEYAYSLLRMLSSTDIGAALMRSGVICAVSLPPCIEIDNPLVERAAAIFSAAQRVQPHYGDCLSPQMYERYKRNVSALLAGQLTPKEAADDLERLAAELSAK